MAPVAIEHNHTLKQVVVVRIEERCPLTPLSTVIEIRLILTRHKLLCCRLWYRLRSSSELCPTYRDTRHICRSQLNALHKWVNVDKGLLTIPVYA